MNSGGWVVPFTEGVAGADEGENSASSILQSQLHVYQQIRQKLTLHLYCDSLFCSLHAILFQVRWMDQVSPCCTPYKSRYEYEAKGDRTAAHWNHADRGMNSAYSYRG
jgi:hypothetical protein